MSADRSPWLNDRSQGFTLLEVVIATAIAALALIALFKIASGGVMAVETATHVEEAVERARSHLDALGHGTSLSEGDYEGDDGGGFHWRLSVHPLAIRPGSNTEASGPAAELFAVDVTVWWKELGRRRAVTLTTLHLQTSG
jgi:general secretion pathway protein I